MATYTITTAQNVTALTAKAGSDTYNINGGTLTIDCDSRYGPNQSPLTGALGNINISATLGGTLVIDGTKVRAIPYDGGSGTAPAAGTIISQGGVSAELLRVMPLRTGGVVGNASKNFSATASSSDGTKLVAAVAYDYIYTSTDSGATWMLRVSSGSRNWKSVASSSDGTKLVAVGNGEYIYTSTDSGATWVQRGSSRPWQSVASSSDGTKLVAVVYGGYIYTSTDSGVTWVQRGTTRNYFSVASSADGTNLVAMGQGVAIYTSTDSGVTWGSNPLNSWWYAVASSSDGTKLVAVVYGGYIYTSTDSGVTWVQRGTSRNYFSVASSADGTNLVAVVYGGYIYTSTDSGVTWVQRGTSRLWQSVASSSDGTKLMAVVYGGGIYTSTDSGVTWQDAWYGVSNILPATGWLKVRNVSGGSFTAGALTGISATATAADETSFIEVVGKESTGVGVPRLGAWHMTGVWFDAGTTSGTRGQTIQLPAYGPNTWWQGVWIETAPGSGTYEHYNNVNTHFTAAMAATDAGRGKVVKIDTNGLLSIGGDGAVVCGYLPASGCKVRVPNIMLSNTGSESWDVNVVPSTTIGTRYDMNLQNAGVLNHKIANANWGYTTSGAYAVTLESMTFAGRCEVQGIVTAFDLKDCHIGQVDSTSWLSWYIYQCFGGGTMANCSAVHRNAAAAGTIMTTTNCDSVVIRDVKLQYCDGPRAYDNICLQINTTNASLFERIVTIGGRVDLLAASNSTVKDTIHANPAVGSTTVNGAGNALQAGTSSINCLIDGLTMLDCGGAQVHPYSAYASVGTGFNITVRNLGTPAAPLPTGTVNACAYGIIDASNSVGVRFQRCWFSGTFRTNIFSGNKSTKNLLLENIYSSDATRAVTEICTNMITRGLRGNAGTTPPYALTGTFGTHFYDGYTGDTTARAQVLFTERTDDPTSAASYTVNAGKPWFLANGTINMQAAGDQVTWEWPWDILGWTGLASFTATGTNPTNNHGFEYALNTGAGFGAFKVLNNANLLTESISPAGFRLKIRVTCTVSNPGNILQRLYIDGTTTKALQDAALRPMDTNTVTFTGLPVGCDAFVLSAGTSTLLDQRDSLPGTSYGYTFSGAQSIDVGFIKPGYVPFYIRDMVLTASDSSVPVSLLPDRNYL